MRSIIFLLSVVAFKTILSFSPPCQYGVDCRLPCHCAGADECSRDTGRCPRGCDNDGTPIHAWAGLDCQIGNIAYNKPAFQSQLDDFLPASNAVDGFIDPLPGRTITNAEAMGVDGPAWWMVDLQDLFNIFRVDVTGSNLENMLDPLRNSRVLIDTDRFFSSEEERLCGTISSREVRRTVPVDCGGVIPGRYVKVVRPDDVDFSDILTLQEVQVFGTPRDIPVVRQCPERVINWRTVLNPVDGGCPVDRMLCMYYIYKPFINEINDVVHRGSPRELCVYPQEEEEEESTLTIEVNRWCPEYLKDQRTTYNPTGGRCPANKMLCLYYVYEPFINELNDVVGSGAPKELCVDPEVEPEEEAVEVELRCPQQLQNTDSVVNPVDDSCPLDKMLCLYNVNQPFLTDDEELVEPGSPRPLCVTPE